MAEQEHLIAVDRAILNYSKYPNVCGVSYGSKFSNGSIEPFEDAIQFFVTEKIAEEELKRSLPRFVYARNADGSLNHSQKIKTDVIDLVDLQLCCAAGNEIASSGDGTTTLIFSNKAINDDQMLVLTCSHVVKGLDQSPPQDGSMVGGDGPACGFVAQTLGNSVLEDEVFEYDIAVGEITVVNGTITELQVDGGPTLDGFASIDVFEKDNLLSVSSHMSGNQFVCVNSIRSQISEIEADNNGRKISAKNVFVCTGHVEKGDSGGIVYDGTRAAGIVIGKAKNDWVLIQPLEEAVSFLSGQLGIEIKCF